MFRLGAPWNWLVAASMISVFAMSRARSALGLPAETDLLSLHLLAACIAVFGLGYYWVSRDLSRNQDIARMGLVGKLLVFAVAFGHAAAGRVPWPVSAPAVVDLGFAILFWQFLRSSERTREPREDAG